MGATQSVEARRVGDTIFLAHHTSMSTIANRDWQPFIDENEYSAQTHGFIKIVVFTSSSAPDAHQRRQFLTICKRIGFKNVQVWVFTEAIIPRMAIRTLRVVGINIRAHSPGEYNEVATALGLTADQSDEILNFISQYGHDTTAMRSSLGPQARNL